MLIFNLVLMLAKGSAELSLLYIQRPIFSLCSRQIKMKLRTTLTLFSRFFNLEYQIFKDEFDRFDMLSMIYV